LLLSCQNKTTIRVLFSLLMSEFTRQCGCIVFYLLPKSCFDGLLILMHA